MKGGKGNNLIRSFTTADTPALAAIIGDQAQGKWTLKVADRAKRNIGMLKPSITSKAAGSFFSLSFIPTVLAPDWFTVSLLFKEFLFPFCENEIFVTINAFYLFISHM